MSSIFALCSTFTAIHVSSFHIIIIIIISTNFHKYNQCKN